MPDILIRNLSEQAVEAIDKLAADLGLSRNEYLRRKLEVDISFSGPELSIEDIKRATYAARDLLDPEIMDGAWR